jgi:hypothetical protein
MQKRAKIGGEIGMNGEFYMGGEFLPNTQLASQGKADKKAATRKQNVEGYKWEVAPAPGLIAIYPQLSGVQQYNRNTNTFSPFMPYYSKLTTEQQQRADDLMARYNKGERWI